jgi:hypothetical protein
MDIKLDLNRVNSADGSAVNCANGSGGTGYTGVNPFPCIGGGAGILNPSTVTVGASNVTIYGNPLGALGDFFNVQYLTVEAMCAVTHRPLKPGEPVLILDEHIISKAAFMKLLREGFERMMLRVEEMHTQTGYDS